MSVNEVGKIYQRPWGSYQTLSVEDGMQVKKVMVNPGGRLSLQKHCKRSEHWLVVRGEAKVTVDELVKTYNVGEYVHIPCEAKHRLENFSEDQVVIIEVQLGSYLGEDDIQRFDDVYGRS